MYNVGNSINTMVDSRESRTRRSTITSVDISLDNDEWVMIVISRSILSINNGNNSIIMFPQCEIENDY